MHKRLRIAIPIGVVIAVIIVWNVFFRNGNNPDRILLSGNIEVNQVDMAFKIPGRLAERTVDEGDRIVRGRPLARLDAADQQLLMRKAAADLEYARAVLDELTAGSRPEEIKRAEARMKQAGFLLKELETGSRSQEVAEGEAELQRAVAAQQAAASRRNLARAELERFQAVYQEGGISRQAFDSYHTGFETAQNRLDEAEARVLSVRQRLSMIKEGPRDEKIRQARAAFEQAQAEYDLVKEGPRRETIAQSRARAAAAEEALNLYKQQLADTELIAPFDGVVLSKSAEPGAYLNPGTPVMTVAEMDRVFLRAFISETDLGRIKHGQSAEIATDAYPGKVYPGRVSFIASQAEFTPKSVQTFEERVNLMYRIKIDLENQHGELKPGMPADAWINVKQ
ncbi:MAG: efflux RND transporter periplasmic adaptor subunit [Thermodesulfobacteriota bacterium]